MASFSKFHKSFHQCQVESFMNLAKQELPGEPTEPSGEVRVLRARLILEEALETIRDGLGVNVFLPNGELLRGSRLGEFEFWASEGYFNMAETIDGCCDLAVVATGTLSACGIPDSPFQDEVNRNNILKMGPGHSWREDGKLIKPPSHQPPQIERILKELQEANDGRDQAPPTA